MKAVGLLKGFAAKSIFSPPGHARKGSLKNGSDYESLVVQNLSEREHQLFDAAEHGDYAAVSELIDKFGVNVQAADQYGFTALSHAALEGHYDICRLLLSRGALINGTHGLQTKGDASTPLHLACSTGNSPIVKLFLHGKHGQRVFLDAQTRATGPEGSGGGWTALHLAASIGDKTIVSSLLAAGANKTIRNDKLQTPADVAADSNTRRLIQEYVYRKRAQRRTSDNSSDGSEMAAAAGGGGGGEDDEGEESGGEEQEEEESGVKEEEEEEELKKANGTSTDAAIENPLTHKEMLASVESILVGARTAAQADGELLYDLVNLLEIHLDKLRNQLESQTLRGGESDTE